MAGSFVDCHCHLTADQFKDDLEVPRPRSTRRGARSERRWKMARPDSKRAMGRVDSLIRVEHPPKVEEVFQSKWGL